jgi:hypothetical protein
MCEHCTVFWTGQLFAVETSQWPDSLLQRVCRLSTTIFSQNRRISSLLHWIRL